MTVTAAPPAWARGYDVTDLKRITALFKAHDGDMVRGAFGRYSETAAADDLAADRLLLGPRRELDQMPTWAVVERVTGQATTVKDFTRRARLQLPRGVRVVSRMAWLPADEAARAAVDARIEQADAVECWQEHPGERELLRGWACGAVEIKASSEMRAVYLPDALGVGEYPRHQAIGLAQLMWQANPAVTAALLAQAEDLDYTVHYSGYNKGASWTALALRGFYDDPARIEKPSEMNRKWKQAHPDDLANEVRDTPLRAQMPAVEPLLQSLPNAGLQRVRIMRLAPGGGELERHADTVDRESGAEPGEIVRIHIPLQTNPDVRFWSWDLDGREHTMHMAENGAYYLDTRKPHRAVNGGDSQRVHLVVDCIASPGTIVALNDAVEAPLATAQKEG